MVWLGHIGCDYQAIFHFGDPRDAIEFKLLFG